MLYCELEDPTGRIEVIVFPKVYTQFAPLFKEGQILVMEGRLDLRTNNLQFSCNNVKSVSLESMVNNAKEAGLFDAKEKMKRKVKVFDSMVEGKEIDPMDEMPLLPPQNSGDWKENPYVIEVSAKTPMEKLEMLRSLLIQHPGERQMELHLGNKEIKLPLGVNLTSDLENEIRELLK
jgi:DNA polymerase-3 subunit alpha